MTPDRAAWSWLGEYNVCMGVSGEWGLLNALDRAGSESPPSCSPSGTAYTICKDVPSTLGANGDKAFPESSLRLVPKIGPGQAVWMSRGWSPPPLPLPAGLCSSLRRTGCPGVQGWVEAPQPPAPAAMGGWVPLHAELPAGQSWCAGGTLSYCGEKIGGSSASASSCLCSQGSLQGQERQERG